MEAATVAAAAGGSWVATVSLAQVVAGRALALSCAVPALSSLAGGAAATAAGWAAWTVTSTLSERGRRLAREQGKGAEGGDDGGEEEQEDVTVVVALSLLYFWATGGRFRNLMPSNLVFPGAFARGHVSCGEQIGKPPGKLARESLSKLAALHGCHTCGKRGLELLNNTIADHIPPSALVLQNQNHNPEKAKRQRLFPQCHSCSMLQSKEVAAQLRLMSRGATKVHRDSALRYHAGRLRFYHTTGLAIGTGMMLWPLESAQVFKSAQMLQNLQIQTAAHLASHKSSFQDAATVLAGGAWWWLSVGLLQGGLAYGVGLSCSVPFVAPIFGGTVLAAATLGLEPAVARAQGPAFCFDTSVERALTVGSSLAVFSALGGNFRGVLASDLRGGVGAHGQMSDAVTQFAGSPLKSERQVRAVGVKNGCHVCGTRRMPRGVIRTMSHGGKYRATVMKHLPECRPCHDASNFARENLRRSRMIAGPGYHQAFVVHHFRSVRKHHATGLAASALIVMSGRVRERRNAGEEGRDERLISGCPK